MCALTRISDLRIARELVLTTQKEVGRNNAGTIQHCKVMILDIGVLPVVCLSFSIQEQAVLPVECTFLRRDRYAELRYLVVLEAGVLVL